MGIASGWMPSVRFLKPPGGHLTRKEVELAIAVGEKRDDFSIGRDLGVAFGASPVGQEPEAFGGQRVLESVTGRSPLSNVPTATPARRVPPTAATVLRPLGPERAGAGVVSTPGKRLVHAVDLDPHVADVSQALLRVLGQTRNNSRRTDGGVVTGSADQSGSRSSIFAIESETVSPANATRPVNIW